MSSSSEDNDSGAEEETVNGDTETIHGESNSGSVVNNGTPVRAGRIVELLEEELEDVTTPPPLGNGTNIFKLNQHTDSPSEDGSVDAVPKRSGSPIDSILSIPDDTPSVQVLFLAIFHELTDMYIRDPYFPLLEAVVYYHP